MFQMSVQCILPPIVMQIIFWLVVVIGSIKCHSENFVDNGSVREYHECLKKKNLSEALLPNIWTVFEYQSISLPCMACIYPGEIAQVSWIKINLNGQLHLQNIQGTLSTKQNYDVFQNSLKISNISMADSGTYMCFHIGDAPTAHIVDFVSLTNATYVGDHATGLEKTISFKRYVAYNFVIYYAWSEWSQCSNCNKVGIRRRIGHSQMRKTDFFAPVTVHGEELSIFNKYDNISCSSGIIPSFIRRDLCPGAKVLLEFCTTPCNISETSGKNKSVSPTTQTVEDGAHVTLRCAGPNTGFDTVINWKYNNLTVPIITFNRNTSVFIDAEQILHIPHMSIYEEGTYSCWINGKRIQEFQIDFDIWTIRIIKSLHNVVFVYLAYLVRQILFTPRQRKRLRSRRIVNRWRR